MTWVKVCDNFDTDRRIEDVSLEATGLFIRSVAYSARYLLDGVVDERWVRRRVSNARKRQKLVEELIDADLWRPHSDGYELVPVRNGDVDHLVSHWSKAEAEERRRNDAEKKRNKRAKDRAENGSYDGSVPEGHTEDSPVRPRAGQVRKGWVTGTPKEQIPQGSDPWELQPEEKADPAELAAQSASFSHRPLDGGAR